VADPNTWDIIKTVIGPAFGIIGGWVTASLKTTGRVTNLEKDLGDLARKYKEERDESKREYKEKLEAMSKGFQLALETLKHDLGEESDELKKDLNELEKSFNTYTRNSHHDFTNNDEFRRFTEEWQRQCHNIQRTLGQIEGMVKRETLISSRQSQQDLDPLPESGGLPRLRR
jgi:hypothetical protein